MNTIEWINKLASDNRLDAKDKIALLRDWQDKVEAELTNYIYNSEEFNDLVKIINHIDEQINKLS